MNTELRELSEPRVFDYFDYVTLDDGELPVLALLEHLQGKRSQQETDGGGDGCKVSLEVRCEVLQVPGMVACWQGKHAVMQCL